MHQLWWAEPVRLDNSRPLAYERCAAYRLRSGFAFDRSPEAFMTVRKTCYLSKHTFFCLTNNHYVFLDLRRDKYLCLGRRDTNSLRGLLGDCPSSDSTSPSKRPNYSRHGGPSFVTEALLQQGLLVRDPEDGKLFVETCVTIPRVSVMEELAGHQYKLRPKYVWSFLSAAALASRQLSRSTIENTVEKIKSSRSGTRTAVSDQTIVASLYANFQSFRPLYPRSYLCLFDSLALVHFLSRFGVFPDWVFGVKLEPFGAHCWVQAEDILVNDLLDNVRGYTPIMVV